MPLKDDSGGSLASTGATPSVSIWLQGLDRREV